MLAKVNIELAEFGLKCLKNVAMPRPECGRLTGYRRGKSEPRKPQASAATAADGRRWCCGQRYLTIVLPERGLESTFRVGPSFPLAS